jgi:hypothetical protein
MTKISIYQIDEYVTADDKWIGTDVNTYNKTKNFTPRKLSNYFNGSQVINTGVDLLYKYFTITPPETRPTGTLSFETEIGPTVNFSAISTFLLSNTTLKGNYIVEFFDFLVGTNVLLYKAKNINLFGSYKINSVEEYLEDPNFFVVNVEFIEGNGFIEEDEDYMISLIDISSGGGSQDLQEVTDIGSSTTNSITANSFIKIGGTGTNILLDNGSTVALSSIGGNTNLSTSQTSTNFTINSSTGDDATVPLGDGTLAGATLNNYTTTEKNKLAAITGTNTGDQNLQQVTDLGATTDNIITVYRDSVPFNGIQSTLINWDFVSDNIDTYAIKGVNGNVNSNSGAIQGTGVYGQGAPGVWGIGEDGLGGGIGLYGEGGYSGIFGIGNTYGGFLQSNIGTALFVTSNEGINASLNLGSTSKGLVINSGGSSTGNTIEINKDAVNKLTINQQGELTATKLIKSGGFDFQFLKADGSVDNNTYLTSADLPSTLDLYATTSPDPVIAGYTALVRNITDTRYNTTAVDVLTPTITGTLASPTFCGAVISDPSILLGNPGVFNFSVIGKIRRTGGSTSSGADFFFSIYKRDISGVETKIADSSPVVVPANGGIYVEYISIALWNNGIFLSTDRVVLKFYGVKTGGGSGASYEFLFGGDDPVRGTASISSAIIPNIYLKDLADVEKTPALNNEILYWNDAASLWEHSAAVDLIPDASATQKGLVSIGLQTFAGSKTFSSQTILGDGVVGTPTYGLLPQATVGSTTGGVFDIRNTNTNIVAGNTVGTLQFSAKDDNSIAYSTAQIKAITQNGIGTGGSGKTDLIFYTSNGSSSIERVKMNDLGLVINSEVTSTIASFDSNKSIKSLTTADGYPSLVELKYVSGVTSAIQGQLNGKQPINANLTSISSLSTTGGVSFVKVYNGAYFLDNVVSTQGAYTILANNTNASATPTEQPFENLTNQTYSGAIVWSPGTAPSTNPQHTYSLSQVGNLVTLIINLSYGVAGAATLTSVTLELPSTAPTPALPTSVIAANEVINYGSGMMIGSKVVATSNAAFCALRRNSTNTASEIVITRTAAAYRYAYVTIQYFV